MASIKRVRRNRIRRLSRRLTERELKKRADTALEDLARRLSRKVTIRF